jgi:hypothetical protein
MNRYRRIANRGAHYLHLSGSEIPVDYGELLPIANCSVHGLPRTVAVYSLATFHRADANQCRQLVKLIYEKLTKRPRSTLCYSRLLDPLFVLARRGNTESTNILANLIELEPKWNVPLMMFPNKVRIISGLKINEDLFQWKQSFHQLF